MFRLNKRYQNTDVFKNLCGFLRLGVNVEPFTTPIVFLLLFLIHLLDELAEILSASVQYVARWSAEIQDWNCFLTPENFRL